jgi:hypothetical protein
MGRYQLPNSLKPSVSVRIFLPKVHAVVILALVNIC